MPEPAETFHESGVNYVIEASDVSIRYSGALALKDVSLDIPENGIMSIIGPSGCGKSSLLRVFNRMNDLIPGAAVSGKVLYHRNDLYAEGVDPVEVRRRIGMVFQKPNPFPKSIFDNVAFGPRKLLGIPKKEVPDVVEGALRQAVLWDSVKDRLGKSAMTLSGGEQQRLCIARALSVSPDVLLMDEPCSALDPQATSQIEGLIKKLVTDDEKTIVIVTHNMQQAGRLEGRTAFISGEQYDDHNVGILVEEGPTSELFTNPLDSRTEDFITGRFG